MLQSVGWQRVGPRLITEQQQKSLIQGHVFSVTGVGENVILGPCC